MYCTRGFAARGVVEPRTIMWRVAAMQDPATGELLSNEQLAPQVGMLPCCCK